jgi:hypothetical protein
MSVSTISSIAFAMTLRCDSTTPFDAPVVPPVYRIAAGASAATATSGRDGGPRKLS